MDYKMQKEITKKCYEEGKITKEQYDKEIAKCDKALEDQEKRLMDLIGKI